MREWKQILRTGPVAEKQLRPLLMLELVQPFLFMMRQHHDCVHACNINLTETFWKSRTGITFPPLPHTFPCGPCGVCWVTDELNQRNDKRKGGFPGDPVVKNPPCSAGDASLIPGPRRAHMPQGSQVRAPQLLSPCATVSAASAPRARALQEKPPNENPSATIRE